MIMMLVFTVVMIKMMLKQVAQVRIGTVMVATMAGIGDVAESMYCSRS